MRVFRDLLDNSCPGCSCCGDGAQPTFLPSWCGSCIWVLCSWMHCPTSTLCSATTDLPGRQRRIFLRPGLSSAVLTKLAGEIYAHCFDSRINHYMQKIMGLFLSQSLSRLFYITGQFTYVPYFRTWRRMQQFFLTMVHTYVATYCHIPEEDTPVVIKERASNIEDNVFLASSSYYAGFKGITTIMKFSYFKNTFSRICTPEPRRVFSSTQIL